MTLKEFRAFTEKLDENAQIIIKDNKVARVEIEHVVKGFAGDPNDKKAPIKREEYLRVKLITDSSDFYDGR